MAPSHAMRGTAVDVPRWKLRHARSPGERILMTPQVQASDDRNAPLVVIENWCSELKRIVNKR